MAQLSSQPESSEITPADLARRIGNGEHEAEGILVQQYQRPLLEMLCRRSGDPELAQDLLQDTLTIIIKRLRSRGLDDPEKMVAFMHRTAHNLVIGHFRKEARRDTRIDTDLVEIQRDDHGSQLEALLEHEEGEMVLSLLKELRTPRDREVLQRFYVWEQEKLFICQAMELTAEQFDRVISRARQRFRELVQRAWEDR